MPPRPATAAAISLAAQALRDGGLVAFPTETVYGLGADASNGLAVAAIYAAKGRPSFNPLIVHVPDAERAWHLGCVTPQAATLAAAFWPGPLTLVMRLRADAGIADLALAGLRTIAVRVPAHPAALALLEAAGRPIAAPSANRSGRISPTTAAHVAAEFGAAVPIILDGGETAVGLESTIVDVSGPIPMLLRPGGVTRAEIEAVLGRALALPSGGDECGASPSAPGQLASHYAPRAAVRLNVRDVRAGEALLAFGTPLPHAGAMLNLSPQADVMEAAARLFAALRVLDETGVAGIAAMPVPMDGLGEAINDRLRRAAAARDLPPSRG